MAFVSAKSLDNSVALLGAIKLPGSPLTKAALCSSFHARGAIRILTAR